jgi:hypothetical protein
MRSITVYESSDGSRWDIPGDAIARDTLIREVAAALAPLGPDLRHRRGYKQHRIEDVRRVRAALLEFLPISVKSRITPDIDPMDVDPMFACRIHDGTQGEPIVRAWSRIAFIDNLGREWEQPYYGRHPDQAPHPFPIEEQAEEVVPATRGQCG